MEFTKNFKRFLALSLVLVLMILPVNINASEDSATLDDLTGEAKKLTEELFTTAYAEKTADLVQAVYDIDKKEAFISAFEDAFAELNSTDKKTLEAFAITTDAVKVFVEFVQDNEDTISIKNLTSYIRNRQREEFEKALKNHEKEINKLLKDTKVTEEILTKGFNKLDVIFGVFDKLQENQTTDDQKLFDYYTNSKTIYVRSSDVKILVTVANTKYGKEYIKDAQAVVESLEIFANYYNNSCNTTDKKVVYDYLNGVRVVNTIEPSSGGSHGGSGGGGGSHSSSNNNGSMPASDRKLDLLASKLSTGKLSGEEATSKVTEIVNELAESLADVKDQEDAYEALKSVSAVLGSTEKVIDKLKDAEAKKAVVNEIERTLDSTIVVLDMVKNASTVNLKAKAIIKDVAGIKDVLKDDAASLKKLDKLAVNLAEVAVSKAGTVKVASNKVKFAGAKATANLSDLNYKAQIEKTVEAEKEMTKFLADNKIDATKDFDVKMVLEVPTTKSTKEVNVTLPDLTDAFVSVDKVKVESGVASFELGAQTFGKKEAAQVKLSASKVDASTLTSAEKQSVPSGVETLIELNAYTDGNKVSEFNKTVEVTIPYELKDKEDAEKVSAYLLTAEGKVEKAAGRYNPLTGKISVMRKHFSKYFVAPSTDKFNDLADYSWAKKPIEVLAGKGIINGMSEGVYGPSSKLTRAQFVALITRMYQLDASQDSPFDDVAADAWYIQDVAAAYQNGIINGVSETEFAPNNTITRQEAAKVIVNVLKYLGYKEEADNNLVKDVYADFDNIDSWAKSAVSTTVREEIFTAQNGDNFNPKDELTRAEAAVMIYNLFLVD